MTTIRIGDMVQNRILVTRTSARNVGAGVADRLSNSSEAVALDFDGIRGITPSFFDELLLSMGKLAESGEDARHMRILNPPLELSSIHEAIGRSHGLAVSEAEDGSWVIGRPGAAESGGETSG